MHYTFLLSFASQFNIFRTHVRTHTLKFWRAFPKKNKMLEKFINSSHTHTGRLNTTSAAIKMQLNFLPHIFSFSAYSHFFSSRLVAFSWVAEKYISSSCLLVLAKKQLFEKFFVYKMFLMYCFWLFITCCSEKCF